jgi:hypothetical protein
MTSSKEHSVEDCKNVFPTWAWLVGILLGSAAGVGALVWAGSAKMTETDMTLKSQGMRIVNIENVMGRQSAGIDTIISILRQQ